VLRYAITDRGRAFALDAMNRDGYVGPAPVPVDVYNSIVEVQTIHAHAITRERMHAAFRDTVIDAELLDQLGPALHSGKAIFIYGRPGTGKSFIARRLARLLGDPVLVPHALAVGDTVVKLFDPVIHHPVTDGESRRMSILKEGFDERFLLCSRPWVMTGGELTPHMLEVVYEPSTRVHEAPLQVKANNGIYVMDDLGRQRVSTEELLNRWIVPMEYHRDYFHLANGVRFPVRFDVALIFSTNLDPTQLGDEAFLRRMGHKIRFRPLCPDSYRAIWKQVCEEYGADYVDEDVHYVMEELHVPNNVPLLACHPRDLLGAAVDEARYLGRGTAIERAMLDRAWLRFQAFEFRQES
jgi:predicted ATPase with chaperone activity